MKDNNIESLNSVASMNCVETICQSTAKGLPSEEDFIKGLEDSYTFQDYCVQWSEPKYKCPKCEEGGMRKNLMLVLTSIPPQYQYRCDKCGYTTSHHG